MPIDIGNSDVRSTEFGVNTSIGAVVFGAVGAVALGTDTPGFTVTLTSPGQYLVTMKRKIHKILFCDFLYDLKGVAADANTHSYEVVNGDDGLTFSFLTKANGAVAVPIAATTLRLCIWTRTSSAYTGNRA